VATDDGRWIAQRQRVTVGSAVLIVAALIATVVARNMFVAAHRILGWAVASSVVAFLVEPIVARLSRHMKRIFALLLTLIAIGAIAGVLAYGVFANLQSEADHLKIEAPKAAAQIEARTDQLGQYARDFKLKERVNAFVDNFEKHAGSGGQALRTAVGTVPTYFVCGILTIFLLIYGKRMVDGGLAQVSDKARRKRMTDVLADAVGRARGYMGGAIAEAVAFGLVAYAVCRLFDLPAPVVLALLAGAFALLPYIGFFLGAIPIVLFTAGFESIFGAIVLLIAVIAIQIAEALIVRRRVDEKTMHVGPAIPVIVALLGFEIYGLGGAGYGVAIAVLLLALADASATDDDIEIPTPLSPAEPSPATEPDNSST
jgi:predicted PurR-regulated permease PerM